MVVASGENGSESEARRLREELREARLELESMHARLRIAVDREASLAQRLEATERQETAPRATERQEAAPEGKEDEEDDPDAPPPRRARSASQSVGWSPSAASASSANDPDPPQASDEALEGRHPGGDQESKEHKDIEGGTVATGSSAPKLEVLVKGSREAGRGGIEEKDKSSNPLDEFFSQRPVADAKGQTDAANKPARARSPPRRAEPQLRDVRDVRDAPRRSRSRSRSGRLLARRATYPASPQRPGDDRRLTRSEDRGGHSRDQGAPRSLPPAGRRSPAAQGQPRSAERRPFINTAPSGTTGESAKGRGEQVDAFCTQHGIADKARIIMYNMHPDDLQIVLKEGYRLKEANNATGFIITRIRNIETRAGRPWGVKLSDMPSDRNVVRSRSRPRNPPRDSHGARSSSRPRNPPRDDLQRGGFDRSGSRPRNPPRDEPQRGGFDRNGSTDRQGDRGRAPEDDRQGGRPAVRSRERSPRGQGRGQEGPPPRRRSSSLRR